MQLARKLRTLDYFTLAFGSMVGVGWLVVMDDWLGRGGPLGAILGFAVCGVVLLPIGYVYGRLVTIMPDAASEIAYTARVFPQSVSFGTGWMMMLAYWIVCPWEAIAVGKIMAYIFPALNSHQIYSVAGRPVYLPHLVLGLSLTAIITLLNYRGVRVSATFQNWTTFGLIALFVVFTTSGLSHGSVGNFEPLFAHGSGWISLFLILQIVPYFMVGFESVPKCAEEANPDFKSSGFFGAILASIVVGILFYTSAIAIVAYVHPWQTLVKQRFATAFAFEQALGQRWIVTIILAAALLSLLKVFNGNFLAATRLLFAMGRRELIDARAGRVHERYQTPSVAVIAIGAGTAVAVLFGDAILIPIIEVGSMASAIGWLATCAASMWIDHAPRQRVVAATGIVVALALIALKVTPAVPGHFTLHEWIALLSWIAAGVLLRRVR
ncbi:MAG: APC family permease [Acidobacteria bacterium]|nr:APC family permease [Acidobacteriota bacterium]